MDGVGHINACLGLAQELAKRGHDITFLTSKSFEGHFKKWNFKEILLIKKKKEDTNLEEKKEDEDGEKKEDPVKRFGTLLLSSGILSNKTALEKNIVMSKMAENTWTESLDEVGQYDVQIKNAIEELKPDVVILEHFLLAPSVIKSGIPWVMLFSANPVVLYNSDDLPPFKSG